MMRYLLWCFVGLLLLAAACGAYFCMRIEPSAYVELLNSRVKAVTGRELAIGGKVGFSRSLLPTVSAEDVRFQNAPWGSRPGSTRRGRQGAAAAYAP